ncbi:MFS transporter, partial [Aggregatibacter actinomycetemcomitans]|uniref:MFS transporter n=1 Tax=Aggregatibacter actinomycetemcomitans TaxID=714 RepID=UPI001178A8AD
SLGGMLSAGVGIFMLPRFGWPSMFFAAAIPLLLMPLIVYWLPESIGFLIRQGRKEQARALLKRLSPHTRIDPEDELHISAGKGKGASVLELFRHGLALRTAAIWVAFFCCLLMVYALSSWLPKLMAGAGYSLGSSLSFLLALNFGGIAGALPKLMAGAGYSLGSSLSFLLALNFGGIAGAL